MREWHWSNALDCVVGDIPAKTTEPCSAKTASFRARCEADEGIHAFLLLNGGRERVWLHSIHWERKSPPHYSAHSQCWVPIDATFHTLSRPRKLLGEWCEGGGRASKRRTFRFSKGVPARGLASRLPGVGYRSSGYYDRAARESTRYGRCMHKRSHGVLLRCWRFWWILVY